MPSQHEATSLSRSAIISELACIVGEISNLQVEQARICERTAAMQGRIGHLIRDLSITTAISSTANPLDEIRQQVGSLRHRLETMLEDKGPARDSAPAPQAALPGHMPSAQDEARPVKAGEALDAKPVGSAHGIPGESRECRHAAEVEGERAAAAGTTSAADAEPRAPRREPQVHRAGGGLLQDGGSLTPNTKQSDRILDLYAETLMSSDEIAREVGCPTGNPSAYISSGRRQGDGRVFKGDAAREAHRKGRALTLYATTKKKLVEIDREIGARSGTTSNLIDEARGADDAQARQGDELRGMFRKPAEPPASGREDPRVSSPPAEPPPPPASKPEPAEDAVDRDRAQALLTGDAERVIVVDTVAGKIHGPGGMWTTTQRVAKTLAPLSDGRLYGFKRVMDAGKWEKEGDIFMRVPEWTAGLAKIGVTLIHTKHIGLKLNRAEAA